MTTVRYSDTTQSGFTETTLSDVVHHKAYLGPLDIVIVVVYILSTLIIGVWVSFLSFFPSFKIHLTYI